MLHFCSVSFKTNFSFGEVVLRLQRVQATLFLKVFRVFSLESLEMWALKKKGNV